MQDETADGGRYAAMFNEFLDGASMAGTYKPVLLSALVDIAARKEGGVLDAKGGVSTEGGRVRVDLDLVAVPFAKFYWDMVAGFRPRHTPVRMADADNPSRDVNIVDLIEKEAVKMKKGALEASVGAGEGAAGASRSTRGRKKRRGGPARDAPPTLAQLASGEMAEFREKVVDDSIKPVPLDKLLAGGFDLYEIERPGKNAVVLDAEAVAYMRRNAVAIKTALSDMISRHLEANNPSARHVATMVNLNESYEKKIKKVIRLEGKALAERADLAPLYGMSLDLAAGLARLYKEGP